MKFYFNMVFSDKQLSTANNNSRVIIGKLFVITVRVCDKSQSW